MLVLLTGTGGMLILINNRLGGCAVHLSTDNISSLPENMMVSDAHCNPCLFIICMAARICFWNIAVYHIFQYWKVIAPFCHYNCNKTVFFLLSVSTMAWFSHVMVKVLFFNIVYKECHFISTEYIYVFFFCHTFPSHQAGMSSTVSSFLFLLQCYSYVISISWIAAGCCCYTDIQVCLFVQFFWHFGPEI